MPSITTISLFKAEVMHPLVLKLHLRPSSNFFSIHCSIKVIEMDSANNNSNKNRWIILFLV